MVRATLRVTPLEPLGKRNVAAVEAEGIQLLTLLAPGGGDVQILPVEA